MPWPTTDGLRILADHEAALVRRTLGVIAAALSGELNGQFDGAANDRSQVGIEWYDCWDAAQRVWLVERVASALLTRTEIESPAAIFDATVDALFCHVVDRIADEIDRAREFDLGQDEWRTLVLRACPLSDSAVLNRGENCNDLVHWQRAVTSVADRILGPRSYLRAEPFRDGDFFRTLTFLQDRGLPEDYLAQIPPLRSDGQTGRSLRRLGELAEGR